MMSWIPIISLVIGAGGGAYYGIAHGIEKGQEMTKIDLAEKIRLRLMALPFPPDVIDFIRGLPWTSLIGLAIGFLDELITYTTDVMILALINALRDFLLTCVSPQDIALGRSQSKRLTITEAIKARIW